MKKILITFLTVLLVVIGFNVHEIHGADTYRVHFYNSDQWNEVYYYTWQKTTNGDKPVGPAWPGLPAIQEGDSNWWYIDINFDAGVHVIFNARGASQFSDLVITEPKEIFVGKITDETNTLVQYASKLEVEEAVAELEPIDPNTKTTLWFYNSNGWEKVYIYAYGGTFEYEPTGPWPGQLALRDAKTHWYSYEVSTALPVHVIFSDGSDQNKAESYVTKDVYVTIGNDKMYASKAEAEATIDTVVPIPEEEIEEPSNVENRNVVNTTIIDYFYPNTMDGMITLMVIVLTSLLGLTSLLLVAGMILYKKNPKIFFNMGVTKWLLTRVKN